MSATLLQLLLGFPGGSVVKNPPANAGDAGEAGLIPGSERSPGEGNGNLLPYSRLENPMGRGAWQAVVDGVTKELDMTESHTAIVCYEGVNRKMYFFYVPWNKLEN